MVTGDEAHTLLAASSTPSPSASTPDTLGSLGSESITSSTPSLSASRPLTEGLLGAESSLSMTPSPSASPVPGTMSSCITVEPGGAVTVSPLLNT